MKYEAVVIGTSFGGMQALKTILSMLPKDFEATILIVQHLKPSAHSFLPEYLNAACKIEIKEAEEKEDILLGYGYIAPPNYHLMVEKDKTLSLSVSEKVNYARPSIDVLFESAADTYGERVIGIILTGANSDGAKGLKCIKEKGGLTIVQNPKTAEASTMPESAIKMSPAHYILSLADIGQLLNTIVGAEETK